MRGGGSWGLDFSSFFGVFDLGIPKIGDPNLNIVT